MRSRALTQNVTQVSIPEESRIPSSFRGHIDRVSNLGLVSGWCKFRDSDAPVEISVYSDSEHLGDFLASEVRSDLARKFKGAGNFGFRIDLQALIPLAKGNSFTLREKSTGQNLSKTPIGIPSRSVGHTQRNSSPVIQKKLLSLVSIFKNEFEYVIEWIAHHKALGIHHFIIGDNGSDDGTSELLEVLDRAGYITRVPFNKKPPPSPQVLFYNEMLRKYRKKYSFLGFIDADEFWAPAQNETPLAIFEENLQIPDSAGIVLNWRTFGSSGHEKKTEGLVVERFTKTARDSRKFNRHIKTFAQTDRVAKINIHDAVPFFGYRFYTDLGDAQKFESKSTHGPISSGEKFSEHRLNHYVIKSREEFTKKKQSRGYAGGKTDASRPNSFFNAHDINEETFEFSDTLINKTKKIIAEIKETLNRA